MIGKYNYIVEAMQYESFEQINEDIDKFMNYEWYSFNYSKNMNEHLRIRYNNFVYEANKGDWIVKRADSAIQILDDETFRNAYSLRREDKQND